MTHDKVQSMEFGAPLMVARQSNNHRDDCYLCTVGMSDWNRHKNKALHDFDLESQRRPVPHCNTLPVPVGSPPRVISSRQCWARCCAQLSFTNTLSDCEKLDKVYTYYTVTDLTLGPDDAIAEAMDEC